MTDCNKRRKTKVIPVNSAVAHNDVTSSKPATELRRHREQSHAGSAAGGVRTGSRALGSDKGPYEPVKLIQAIERPHQLQKRKREVLKYLLLRARDTLTEKVITDAGRTLGLAEKAKAKFHDKIPFHKYKTESSVTQPMTTF